MCDTLVATAKATVDGTTIFAKNSDREPNEAQHLFYAPAVDHTGDAQVRCTYIEIPQVEHTHAVILSRPFWMWGAEIGVRWDSTGRVTLAAGWRYRDWTLDDGPASFSGAFVRMGIGF